MPLDSKGYNVKWLRRCNNPFPAISHIWQPAPTYQQPTNQPAPTNSSQNILFQPFQSNYLPLFSSSNFHWQNKQM